MANLWRTIDSFPDYEASLTGEVRRIGSARSLKPRLANNGYARVNVYRGGTMSVKTVHSLVAEAWHGCRPDGKQVAHLNGDRTDNRASNLAWSTAFENAGHKRDHGTQIAGERHYRAKLTTIKVRAVRALRAVGWSQVDIAELVEVDPVTVNHVLAGRTWKDVA